MMILNKSKIDNSEKKIFTNKIIIMEISIGRVCGTCIHFNRNFSSSSHKAKSGICPIMGKQINEIFYCDNYSCYEIKPYYTSLLNKINHDTKQK